MKKIFLILAAFLLANSTASIQPAAAQDVAPPDVTAGEELKVAEKDSTKLAGLSPEELEERADKGDPLAAIAYAVYLEEQEEDAAKASKYYEKAAKAGSAEARHRLGLLYRWGTGVPTNGRKAEEWFLKAAEQNYGPALSSLGEIYQDGYVLPLDKAKSVKYYSMAAEFGDPIGEYFIGMKFMHGDAYTQKDYRKAAMWLTRSAEQGHAPAQSSLGILYQYGYGVAQDGRKAYELFIQAAEQGDMNGQYMAGVTLLNQPDPQYFPQGFNYILGAAKQGYVPAMQMMPDLFQQGKGTPQSAKGAYKWHMILYRLTPQSEKQKLGQLKVQMKHLGDYMSNKERAEAKAAADSWVREYREEHGYR